MNKICNKVANAKLNSNAIHKPKYKMILVIFTSNFKLIFKF